MGYAEHNLFVEGHRLGGIEEVEGIAAIEIDLPASANLPRFLWVVPIPVLAAAMTNLDLVYLRTARDVSVDVVLVPLAGWEHSRKCVELVVGQHQPQLRQRRLFDGIRHGEAKPVTNQTVVEVELKKFKYQRYLVFGRLDVSVVRHESGV